MRFDLDLNHKVTGGANRGEMPFFTYTKVNTVIHALRDSDGFLNCIEN